MTNNVLAIDRRPPSLADDTWVAHTATVIGSATIGSATGVFYGAVMRADIEDITIGAGSNIQDTAVVHADPGYPAKIGTASMSDGAVLHGCTVGDGSLIGMNATILNGAVIGGRFPDRSECPGTGRHRSAPGLARGRVPAKVRGPLTPEEIQHCSRNTAVYTGPTQKHRDAASLASSA